MAKVIWPVGPSLIAAATSFRDMGSTQYWKTYYLIADKNVWSWEKINSGADSYEVWAHNPTLEIPAAINSVEEIAEWEPWHFITVTGGLWENHNETGVWTFQGTVDWLATGSRWGNIEYSEKFQRRARGQRRGWV